MNEDFESGFPATSGQLSVEASFKNSDWIVTSVEQSWDSIGYARKKSFISFPQSNLKAVRLNRKAKRKSKEILHNNNVSRLPVDWGRSHGDTALHVKAKFALIQERKPQILTPESIHFHSTNSSFNVFNQTIQCFQWNSTEPLGPRSLGLWRTELHPPCIASCR